MTKVAIVTPNFSLGGAERWINQLLQYVPNDRVQWTGLCLSGFGGADPLLCRTAAKYVKLHTNPVARRSPLAHPFNPDPADIYKLHATFPQAVEAAAEGADMILTWGSANVESWFPRIKIPRISCSHATATEPAPLYPISGLTHLVGCAEIALAYFDNRPGLRDLPRHVIYNGCDTSHITPHIGRQAQRAKWGVTNEKVIGHIGRHAPEKNYTALAKAGPCLPADFRMVYYGRDQINYFSPAADLLELADASDGKIQCFMPEPHVGDVLAGFDALVIASHYEACSLAMLEAWFSGTPVVATPAGSVPELQKKFGELVIEVPMNPDPPTLAAACEKAVGSYGRQVAAHAKRIAEANFTIQQMANNWADYLEQVC